MQTLNMSTDVLKAGRPKIVLDQPRRLRSKLQQLLLLLPPRPGRRQVPAARSGRVFVWVQRSHKRDVQSLDGYTDIVGLVK